MKSVESSGKTIDEAILMAVAQLGVQRDNLDIEILEEPVRGLFGFIGKGRQDSCKYKADHGRGKNLSQVY